MASTDLQAQLDEKGGSASTNSSDIGSNNRHSVWVMGGGIAGLATAAALRVHCPHIAQVLVLERSEATHFYDETSGASTMLGPNGFRALRFIGGDALVQRVLDDGHPVTHIGIVLPGNQVMLIPDNSVRDTPDHLPQLIVRWGRLRRFLQELVPKEWIKTGVGADICGYTLNPQQDNTVFPANNHGEPIRIVDNDQHKIGAPSLLVAADGINSPFQSLVRMGDCLLTGPDASSIRKSNVQDNGRVNIKAVVKMPLDYDAYQLKAMGTNDTVPVGTALAYNAPDGTVSCFAGSAGHGYTYWAISVADQVDERGSVLQYFDAMTEPNSAMAHLRKAKLLKLLQPFQASCQFAIDLIQATDTVAIFVERSHQLTLVGPTFVTADHRVVLVGDAAHAMSPSYGQGGNFGLEDAATLAQCLRCCSHTLPASSNMERALEAYSGLRVERCEEMFRRSAERVARQARGENTDDVQQWIASWEPPHSLEE